MWGLLVLDGSFIEDLKSKELVKAGGWGRK